MQSLPLPVPAFMEVDAGNENVRLAKDVTRASLLCGQCRRAAETAAQQEHEHDGGRQVSHEGGGGKEQ